MKKHLLIILLFYCTSLSAQTERFFKLFDYENGANYFQGLVEYNNKYYATGISLKGATNAFVVCVKLDGELVWKKKLLIDSTNAVQSGFTRLSISKRKTLLISGITIYSDTSKAQKRRVNPAIVELDTNGNILNEWFQYAYYDTLNFGQRVYQLSNNRYVLGNVSYTEDQREYNPSLLLIDSLGNTILHRDYAIFPNKKQVYLEDFIPLKDQGYLIIGYQKAINSNNFNGMLIRVDSNLNVIWKGEYGTGGYDDLSSGIQLKDGHLLVCGYRESLNGELNNYDAWLMKINLTNGTVIREKTFVFKKANTFRKLIEKDDGSIVLAGEIDNLTDSLGSNAHIIKLTPQWEIIWSQNYGMPYVPGKLRSHENVFGFSKTSDGGYMMVGFSHDRSLEPSTQDAMLLKVDSNGCLEEGCSYTGIEQDQKETQNVVVYPNPAKDVIKVKLQDADVNCNYAIVNTLGEIQSKGNLTNTELNIDHLSNGMYFLRLYTKAGILNLKFVKEK